LTIEDIQRAKDILVPLPKREPIHLTREEWDHLLRQAEIEGVKVYHREGDLPICFGFEIKIVE
jgi:hypothetical protein